MKRVVKLVQQKKRQETDQENCGGGTLARISSAFAKASEKRKSEVHHHIDSNEMSDPDVTAVVADEVGNLLSHPCWHTTYFKV